MLLSQRGRYADAEPVLRRALAIRRQVLGGDHRDIGASLSTLGAVYYLSLIHI